MIHTAAFVSPTKWHLAHTSWFFETFVLGRVGSGYQPVHPDYDFLFNSYYDQVGPQFERADWGLLSRPTVEQVYDYRRRVDERMDTLLAGELEPALAPVVELGLHHEQQHQELMLTDIKHVFARNPLAPVYRPASGPEASQAAKLGWVGFDRGLSWIGHQGVGFAFDNEGPRHQVVPGALRAGRSAGERGRVPVLHGRRRLRAP